MNIELTIEKYLGADGWYQAWIIIGDNKQELGRSYHDYDDCRLNCEKFVEECSKSKVYILHSKIYDLI